MAVAEIQGIYGPFTFSEQLLQKIWAQGAYDQSRLCATDGVGIKVINPGKWNRLAGPDFKHARLQLGQAGERVGDVELHLRADDWVAHGHAKDPAYRNVILHVVLFPPRPGQVTRNGRGEPIPTLVLLPWLQHDLEEYAAEAAVENLSNQTETGMQDRLRQMSTADLEAQLLAASNRRWEQKRHFAGLRLGKVGWEEACHQTALEILGYRYNRVPMLNLAMCHPMRDWAGSSALPRDEFIALREQKWNLSGVRPANHPRKRLGQYQHWIQACPDWPQRLLDLGGKLPQVPANESTREVRRAGELSGWRVRLREAITGSAMGGTRLDTLVCDGFLPLLASRRDDINLFGLWYHWFLGDLPGRIVTALRQIEPPGSGAVVLCQGRVQGLLGWMIEQELADH
ncbi:MAG: DUF2851 family protein [Cephaloticoccus sp.]|nr:DUF2851 family protein [Cephaloticoccus sp.]